MKQRHQILYTEFSNEFIDKMKNRVVASYHKYGGIFKNKTVLNYVDTLKNAEYRIECYKKTGNPEYLIDASNYLMFEFMEMRGDFIATDNDKLAVVV